MSTSERVFARLPPHQRTGRAQSYAREEPLHKVVVHPRRLVCRGAIVRCDQCVGEVCVVVASAHASSCSGRSNEVNASGLRKNVSCPIWVSSRNDSTVIAWRTYAFAFGRQL